VNPTNDPALVSWVETAQGSEFPIQNLPWGVFSFDEGPARVGVAIGDRVVDVGVLAEAGLLGEVPAEVFATGVLNDFVRLGPAVWSTTRARLSELLRADVARLRDDATLRARALVGLADVRLHLPIRVEGYTDFYSSREHATNVGRMFRPDAPALLPNWLHLPVGYNGRASTVVVSGTPIRRPLGQTKAAGEAAPSFGPCRRLDLELEMATIVGIDTEMGRPLTLEEAERGIFGYALLNDWSARDIQQWEYVPLGPFQAKVFATSMGPWIVPAEALEPFRVEGPKQDPEPLPYLRQSKPMNYDVELEIAIAGPGGGEATVVGRSNFAHLYWSSAQQLVHHAIGGCAMKVGDILGSGTISGPSEGSFGSLLELTWNGQRPLRLADGSSRGFLEDGDRLTISGRARRDGVTIGFGACSGEILPAPEVRG